MYVLDDSSLSHLRQIPDRRAPHPHPSYRPLPALQLPLNRHTAPPASSAHSPSSLQLSQLCFFCPLGFERELVVLHRLKTTEPSNCVHCLWTRPASAFHATPLECRHLRKSFVLTQLAPLVSLTLLRLTTIGPRHPQGAPDEFTVELVVPRSPWSGDKPKTLSKRLAKNRMGYFLSRSLLYQRKHLSRMATGDSLVPHPSMQVCR